MYSKDALYRITASLTSKEINAFLKEHEQGAEKGFVTLFKLLSKGSNVEEQEIEKKLAKKGIKNLSKLKSYLFDKILYSITNLHQAYTGEEQVRELLNQSYFFLDRMILDVSYQLVQKAELIVQKFELYEYSESILDLMRKLSEYQFLESKELVTTKERVANYIKTSDEIRNYRLFAIDVEYIFTKRFEVEKEDELVLLETEVKNLLAHTLLNNKTETKSLSATIYKHYLKSKLHNALAEDKDSIKSLNTVLSTYETDKEFILGHLPHYLKCLIDLGNQLIRVGKMSDFELIVDRFKTYGEKSSNPNIQVWNIYVDMVLYRKNYEYEKGWPLVEDFRRFSQSQEIRLDSNIEVNFLLNSIAFSFANNKYRTLTRFLQQLHPYTKFKRFEHLFLLMEIIRLVVHFEQKHFDQCEYKIRSIKRFIKVKTPLPWMVIAFEGIEKIVKLEMVGFISPEIRKQVLIDAKTKISECTNTVGMEDFPFSVYLESKIRDVKMTDLEKVLN